MRFPVLRSGLALLTGMGVLAGAPSRSSATTFTQHASTDEGYNGSNGVGISFTTDGSDPSKWWNWPNYTTAEAFTTQFWSSGSWQATAVGSPFLTFCVDLATGLQDNVKFDANVNDSQSGSGPNDANGNARDIGAAGWVMKNYINASSAPVGLSGTTDEKYAAIQIAIWKVDYDHTSTSINGGTFRFYSSDSTVMTDAGTILTAYHNATDPDSTAIGFINYPPNGGETSGSGNQDMIYVPAGVVGAQAVPEPSTIVSAGLGVLALAWYRRHGRKPA